MLFLCYYVFTLKGNEIMKIRKQRKNRTLISKTIETKENKLFTPKYSKYELTKSVKHTKLDDFLSEYCREMFR